MNMIQLKNRPFAGKAPTTTQQAEFSIGWRFCPVCGNKKKTKYKINKKNNWFINLK